MSETIKIWGDLKEIEELDGLLKSSGFSKANDDFIRASEPKPNRDRVTSNITYHVMSGIGKIIKTYLRSKRKILITREDFTVKYEITGDWEPDEIEKVFLINYGMNIQAVPEPLPEPSKGENGMGFHIGQKPPEKP